MDIDAFAAQNGVNTEDIPQLFSDLAFDAYERYIRTGSRDDISEAVDVAKLGIALANSRSALFTEWLNNLGVFLETRYERTGEMGDLEEAIQVARQAIESTPDDHPDRAGRLNNLGAKLGRRYERTGEMGDLEEAIERARQAVESTPDDPPDRAAIRYERTGEMKDLEEAIETARQAVESTPDDHPDRAGCRYKRAGEMRDLEEAIETARQAVESTPDDHPDRAGWLGNLGNKLGRRYERTAEMRDLEEAIETARQAVESTPDGHPDRAGCRYQRTGEMKELEEAIQTVRQAVESTPDDHPDRARIRYKRTGEMGDLEEAIQIARQAVECTPDDHPDRAGRLNNLGMGDLEEAIQIARQAVECTPDDHPDRAAIRYERIGEMGDLEEAIQTARQAVESTPDDHPDRAGCRYERIGEMGDLEEAIQTARQAVESTPDDHPDRAARLGNLGNKLDLEEAIETARQAVESTPDDHLERAGSRYEGIGEMKDLEEASTYLLEAWTCLNAVPFSRHRVDEAIDLGTGILDLLPTQFVMSTFAGVASDLCAFLLSANRLNEALQYLEQGRTVIISQLLDDRSDLSSLRRAHSRLANQYQSLVDEVNTPIRQTTPGVVETLIRKRRQEAMAELDTCLKEIRHIPGYERFMLGQTIAEMQECVTEGSIVVINITGFRSDAILISNNSLSTITLPGLSAFDVRSWASKDWSTKKRSEQREKNDEFLDYLSWLWHTCVKHILAEVSATQKQPSEDLPRVWWIGSGLASSMPFHAAGVHTRGSMENAYSKITSSYTPSIKALAYARNQAKRAQEALAAQDMMLIATMPTSLKRPGDKKAPKDLPGAIEETGEILNSARSHISTTVLTHPSADQVLEVLKTCRIAHFACHGTSDYSDPSNSGLILQKSTGPGEALEQDRLTVHRVSELRLRYAQIAYLSACSTAENKAARLSDEVIHVVSGFQVAGFPHVVGCLWPAGDSECVDVAKRFYSLVLRGNQAAINNNEAASALQEAVMAVRAGDLSMPLNWAQFVHYGA
ncbi:CHAT domain-containing protein [Dactylonectria estremocensis]|uniref:CHAT domain-containing protein n=1 Tax=Dactylonectria estremocensis TaxID=1079267 RepID=A0A9P9D2J8_9HYPO|nr:CHAT domain-containing protein [Dactylonectria estremocensis]